MILGLTNPEPKGMDSSIYMLASSVSTLGEYDVFCTLVTIELSVKFQPSMLQKHFIHSWIYLHNCERELWCIPSSKPFVRISCPSRTQNFLVPCIFLVVFFLPSSHTMLGRCFEFYFLNHKHICTILSMVAINYEKWCGIQEVDHVWQIYIDSWTFSWWTDLGMLRGPHTSGNLRTD